MREIKFRAWDSDRKLMITEDWYDEHRQLEDKNEYYESDIGALFASLYIVKKYSSLQLMQYTGLTDKNGVEIYEGDVLRFHSSFPVNFSVEYGQQEYADDAYQAYGLGWNLDPEERNRYEVIGNIYENPELLGGSNANAS